MQDFPHNLKIVAIWGLVFVVGVLGMQWWLANEKRSNLRVEAGSSMASGQVIVIKRSRDGHYHWPGTVGGQGKALEVDFMLDTGATSMSISQELADKMGLKPFEKANFSTANGDVTGSRTRADVRLEGGLVMERHNLAVMPRMDGVALLGMDILSKFKLEQSDQQLRITLPR